MSTPQSERQPHANDSLPVEVILQGHLTAAGLRRALRPAQDRISARSQLLCMLFDCRTMTGYDRDARELFVDWHRNSSAHYSRIAILLANPLWFLVVTTMALASGKQMKPFLKREEALRWLATRPSPLTA